MKLFKKLAAMFIATALAASCFSLVACTTPQEEEVDRYPNVKSETLYVNKVTGLPKDYIMGMDASSVPSLEAAGVKYYDYEGKEADVFKTLSENGVTDIRVRVWNDPFDADGNGYGGGNNDIKRAVDIGKRATKYGMGLIVDFHYSDFWADPAKQEAPKAWKGMSVYDMADALKDYTKSSLERLKTAGVKVTMVQVGNETNSFMCGQRNWDAIVALMQSGSEAIREVFPQALVAVHFANPENVNRYKDYSKQLFDRELDYDVFGSSYYPYWHGTLENLKKQLDYVSETYGKKTMVMETSYAFTTDDYDFSPNSISDGGGDNKPEPFTVQGQANQIRNVIQATADMKNCIGMCYWEGTMIGAGYDSYGSNYELWNTYGCGWTSDYAAEYQPKDVTKAGGSAVDNQTFFDRDGKPLESLKVFALARKGNIVEDAIDATEDSSCIVNFKGDPKDFPLPDTVKVVMKSGERKDAPVVWKKYRNSGTSSWLDLEENTISSWYGAGVGKYEMLGEAGGMQAVYYVSMIDKNFLENYSFEEDGGGDLEPKSWTVKKNVEWGKQDELFVQDKKGDALTGTKAFHFWREKSQKVNFDLEQKVTASDFVAGNYKYSISIQGAGATSYNIYAYVKINGEQKYVSDGVKLAGWQEWKTATIDLIEVKSGDEVIVGIHVEADGDATSGAWGTVDDGLLNAID